MQAAETVPTATLPEHSQCALLPPKLAAGGLSISNGIVGAAPVPEEPPKKKIKTVHSASHITHNPGWLPRSPSRSPRISNQSVSVAVDSPKSVLDGEITDIESSTESVTSLESSDCSQTAEKKG